MFTDTCEGDSGGPSMYYSNEYNQWMIVGITSYGRGCGESIHAGIYTRVSMYFDWITSITGINDIVIAGKDITTTTPQNSGHNLIMSNLFFIVIFLFLILSYC